MRFAKYLAVVIVLAILILALVACYALGADNNGDKDSNGNDENTVSLADVYDWIDELEVKDIVKVRYERGSLSVASGDLTDVSYSTNSVDIENTYARLLSKLTPLGDDFRFPVGGGYIEYTIFTKNNKTFSLSIGVDLDDGIVYFNNQFYLVEAFKYKFQHSYLDCYSFTDPATSYIVCSAGDDYTEYGNIYLGDLEFCKYDGQIDTEPSYRLMGNMVNLLVLTDKLFVIEGRNTVYQVTSEIDFSKLFATDDVSLSDLYDWIDKLNVEDIVKVRYEEGGIAVAPGSLIKIAYSTNSVDIANTYALLSIHLTALGFNGSLDGGSYVRYDFVTKNNETYTVRISNNMVNIYGKDYLLDKEFYYGFKNADLNCYALVSYSSSYKVQSTVAGNAHDGETINLHYFEFCKYDGEIDVEPSYYLKGDGVCLWVLSGNLFMIADDYSGKNNVYQIVGGQDFSQLFEDNA